ncbi:ABC transporter substrate-binding protein [Natroniella sp. ANB-PHB2]|uniref:ABC transporter substrate-binding protein n=1 Tax=Natroniella sp. ANB-PHB2 TaxID=3384444 RepID=UPI0038D4E9FE
MKNTRKLTVITFLFVLVTLYFVGGDIVEAREYPVNIVDDLGKEIVVEEEPAKIVSLAPSHTEIVFALQGEDKLVGVTEYDNYPKAAQEITSIGTITEPSLERIISLQPDLVLAAELTPKETIQRLEQLGIDVVALAPESVNGVIETISLVGELMGQQDEAVSLTAEMNDKINEVREVIEKNIVDEERPKVFYEVWKEPLYTAGAGTFIDDLIHLAGGINIAHNAQGKWPQYSVESLLTQDPDIYLVSHESEVSKESIQARERFQSIKAIKEGRVYPLDADLLNRAGPRLIIALERLAEVIHPELFN